MAILVVGLRETKKAIKFVENWSQDNSMLLNKKKCGILLLAKRGNTFSKKEKKAVSVEDIPYVKSYKYLGITFNKSLNTNL